MLVYDWDLIKTNKMPESLKSSVHWLFYFNKNDTLSCRNWKTKNKGLSVGTVSELLCSVYHILSSVLVYIFSKLSLRFSQVLK